MIRPGADAVQECDGQDLRQRPVRVGDGSGARARRLEGISGDAPPMRRRARPPARSRARDVPRMDRRGRLRGARDGHRRRRWRDRDLFRDAGDGAGPRDDVSRSLPSTSSACRSRRSGSSRATPTAARASAAPARARSSSAARRCTSPPSAPSRKRKSSPRRCSRPRIGDIEYRDGVFRIAGTDRSIGLFDLARKTAAGAHRARFDELGRRRDVAQRLLTSAKSRSIRKPAPSRSTVYWSVNDVGRVVNPMIVVGQLEGGAAQGIGQALCEAFRLRSRDGPGAHRELPRLCVAARRDDPAFRDDDGRIDARRRNNRLGVKGVGELGTIGATPAVVNAVVDALARGGRWARARMRCRCRSRPSGCGAR